MNAITNLAVFCYCMSHLFPELSFLELAFAYVCIQFIDVFFGGFVSAWKEGRR